MPGITRKFSITCKPDTVLPFNGTSWSTCHWNPNNLVLNAANLYASLIKNICSLSTHLGILFLIISFLAAFKALIFALISASCIESESNTDWFGIVAAFSSIIDNVILYLLYSIFLYKKFSKRPKLPILEHLELYSLESLHSIKLERKKSILSPVDVTIEIDGFSGFTCGQYFLVTGVPEIYNQNGVFQVTNVKHNVDIQDGWNTIIEAQWLILNKS